jgi:hypothetical protein
VEGSVRKLPTEKLGCSRGVVDEEEAKELGCCGLRTPSSNSGRELREEAKAGTGAAGPCSPAPVLALCWRDLARALRRAASGAAARQWSELHLRVAGLPQRDASDRDQQGYTEEPSGGYRSGSVLPGSGRRR